MPAAASRSPDPLDVDEDRPFQELWWTVQRFAWSVFALIVVLALSGLTGSGGWLADATASVSAGRLDYPRVGRWQADDTVSVSFAASARGNRTLTLSSAFTSLFQIIDIEPMPLAYTATSDGENLEFNVSPGETGAVTLHVRSQRPGLVAFFAAIDGERLDATTFVLP